MPWVKESNDSNRKTSKKINHKLYNVSHLMPWQEKSCLYAVANFHVLMFSYLVGS